MILAMTSLFGCSIRQPEISNGLQASFQVLVPIDDLNQSVRLTEDLSNQQNIKFDSVIQVLIENVSIRQVYFPLGYGIKLFIVRNGDWVEIRDKSNYLGDGALLSPQNNKKLTDTTSTRILPDYPSQIKIEGIPVILRIVVIGELLLDINETRVPVGAYIDVIVNP
jgi:hypothetical protein